MFSAGQPLHTISHLLRDLPQSDTGVFLTLDDQATPRSTKELNAAAVADFGTESDGAAKLEKLIDDLEGLKPTNPLVQGQWFDAFIKNMVSKARFYSKLADDMIKQIVEEQTRLNQYNKTLRRSVEEWVYWEGDDALRPDPSRPQERWTYTSLPDNSESKWNLVKDEAPHWKTLIAQYTSIKQLSGAARARKPDLEEFIKALKRLRDYASQDVMLTNIVQLIRAFISVPEVANNMYPNMVIAGDPGTGKSRLANAVGAVLAKLGMLIKDSYTEASSADMIGQYLGETTIKTLNFLTANLERVVFLDEAYALTRYDGGKSEDGTPPRLSEYSKEAVDQLIQFLSQNVGRFALLVAGYEKPMREQFMKANEGFDRRIPVFVVLKDYPENTMISIFLKGLGQSLRYPARTVRHFFTDDAYALLKDIIAESRVKDKDEPWNEKTQRPKWKYDLLQQIFHAQAGAMVNIANEAAVLLSTSDNYSQMRMTADGGGYQAGKDAMRLVLISMAQKRWTNTITNVTDYLAKEADTNLATSSAFDYKEKPGPAYNSFTGSTNPDRTWGGYGSYKPDGSTYAVTNTVERRPFITGWKLAEQEINNALYTTGWMAWRGGYQWNSSNTKTDKRIKEGVDDPGANRSRRTCIPAHFDAF